MMPVKTLDFTKTGAVQANKKESHPIPVPSGCLWEVLALYINVPPVEDQNGENPPQSQPGGHEVRVQSEAPETQPEYFYFGSNGTDRIYINQRSIINASARMNPSNDAALGPAMDAIKCDPNETVQLSYWNQTQKDQTEDREWNVRILERTV